MGEYAIRRNSKRLSKGSSPLKRSLKVFSGVFLLIFAGFFLYNFYNFFTSSSYFFVKEVEVVGNNRLAVEDIVKSVGLAKDSNIFSVDISSISNVIRGNPWVKDVSVSRLLPDKLSVKLIERRPVAILSKKGIYLIGDDGTVMEKIEDYSAIPLPLLIGTDAIVKKIGNKLESSSVVTLIEALAFCEESSFITHRGISSIQIMRNDKINLITRQGDISVIIDGLYLSENLKKLDRIEEFIGASFVKKIDLSFKGQAIVI